jgi:hypothetical protein
MKRQSVISASRVLPLLLLASGTYAVAEDFGPAHFSGLINDYSPATVKGGPWEMHGQWTLDLHRQWDGNETADFSADMTMSGYVTSTVLTPDGSLALQTQPGVNPHTHHLKLTNVQVVKDMTGCPAYLPPATTVGFHFSHVVSLVTGNGGVAPFETTPPTSSLQVCVTGGTEVADSNITLVFLGPATGHFGTQPIHGVVRKAVAEFVEDWFRP